MQFLYRSRLLSVIFSTAIVFTGGCAHYPIGEMNQTFPNSSELRTVLASSHKKMTTAKLDCADIVECVAKWKSIENGWTNQQVLMLLGEPVSVVDPEIYIDRVRQQWLYRDGSIVFDNGMVSSIEVTDHSIG